MSESDIAKMPGEVPAQASKQLTLLSREHSAEELDILAELPFLEQTDESEEASARRGMIICPACGDEVDRELFIWDIHWNLNHQALREKLIKAGFDWYGGRP